MKFLFYIFFGLSLLFLLTGCLPQNQPLTNNINNINSNINDVPEESDLFFAPLDKLEERVTKKPFGIYITPANSPVSPEKFSGYHTGADFEILPGEENQDIMISAICEGRLLEKRTATGYGGIIVQACLLDNEDITVIYGHLDLDSISAKVGDTLKAGQALGLLGDGYSTATDGERKHLHLGIHRGTDINIRGYVASAADLDNWYDPIEIIDL